jgi:hypothetical protein
MLGGITILWPLLQDCGVRAKFGTSLYSAIALSLAFLNYPEKFLARSLNFLFCEKIN